MASRRKLFVSDMKFSTLRLCLSRKSRYALRIKHVSPIWIHGNELVSENGLRSSILVSDSRMVIFSKIYIIK